MIIEQLLWFTSSNTGVWNKIADWVILFSTQKLPNQQVQFLSFHYEIYLYIHCSLGGVIYTLSYVIEGVKAEIRKPDAKVLKDFAKKLEETHKNIKWELINEGGIVLSSSDE